MEEYCFTAMTADNRSIISVKAADFDEAQEKLAEKLKQWPQWESKWSWTRNTTQALVEAVRKVRQEVELDVG